MVSAPIKTTTTTQRSDFLKRLGVGLGLGLPLVVFSLIAAAGGWISPEHSALLDKAGAIAGEGVGPDDLGSFYPPIPVILALALGSGLGLSVVSSFLAGGALYAVWTRMIRRGLTPSVQVVLVASTVLLPAVWYVASQDLALIGGLTMLVLALDGFIRFTVHGETSGGFTAGLCLAGALLFGAEALAYTFCLVVAAIGLGWSRYRGTAGALRAVVMVLAFPTLALLGSWLFLQWQFTGETFVDIGLLSDLGSPVSAVWAVLRDLGRVPVYLLVGALLVRSRPIFGFALVLPLVGLVLVEWMANRYTAVMAIILLSFLAMISFPRRSSRFEQGMLLVAALGQLAINIAWPIEAVPALSTWLGGS